jgi:hypothetical protein
MLSGFCPSLLPINARKTEMCRAASALALSIDKSFVHAFSATSIAIERSAFPASKAFLACQASVCRHVVLHVIQHVSLSTEQIFLAIVIVILKPTPHP